MVRDRRGLVSYQDEPRREITKQLNIGFCISDERSCVRSGFGKWTDNKCCSAGHEAACARVGGTWSGALCCLDGEPTCLTAMKLRATRRWQVDRLALLQVVARLE